MSLVGVSDHVVELRAGCAAVGPLPCRAVITGETGTGKGLVARLLHGHSGRAGPFVQRGAGEKSATPLQDDLFGHVRGAYTGATERRRGQASGDARACLGPESPGCLVRPPQR